MPRSNAPIDPQRDLMIKTKICQRLIKEYEYYQKEVIENQEQLQDMKNAKQDPYDIKKFEEVLGESKMMVPDSKRRLQKALHELQEFVTSTTATGEWLDAAHEVLNLHNKNVDDTHNDVLETNVDDLADGEAF